MKANKFFLSLPLEFWANVRLISQKAGYTNRNTGGVRIPTNYEIVKVYKNLGMNYNEILSKDFNGYKLEKCLRKYFKYRANFLNNDVRPNLMDLKTAHRNFNILKKKYKPTCLLPMNKQTGNKKTPAYFTSIVNILIEANAKKCPHNLDPKELTSFTKNGIPIRSLSRRVDGAFPNTVNPIAIWEIKEYYYTTTFGSRIADGIYESQLDGMELMEIKNNLKIDVEHYLMVDAYDTWWLKGKSYLCRICDMLNMGILTEALFGKEVVKRLPIIVKNWRLKFKKQKILI